MTTLEAIQEILQKNFPLQPEALQRDAKLEDLDIDSLSVVEVLFEVEERFGIAVPSDSGTMRNQLTTIGELADYVDALIREQHPTGASGAGST